LAIAVLDASESKRTMTLMQAFALDQREAAEIFDGGVNAFSRYETGKARPLFATIADNASAFKRQGDCITMRDIHLYNQRAPCPPLLKSNPR
jgi:hypothetical protein